VLSPRARCKLREGHYCFIAGANGRAELLAARANRRWKVLRLGKFGAGDPDRIGVLFSYTHRFADPGFDVCDSN